MEDQPCHNSHVSAPSSSSLTAAPPENPSSSSSPSTSQLQADEANQAGANENNQHNHQHQQQPASRSYWVNISITNPSRTAMKDDVWYCMVVLATFWIIASVTLALGICGSVSLQLGPYCSRLIDINSVLVQSVKVEQIDKPKPGLLLYGFDKPPPLDVKINWTEMYNASIPAKFQKEWIFYLNKDSQLDVLYSVKSPAALFLVISKGREDLVEWIENPSIPNATFYWNTIYGSGRITKKMSHSHNYYVAVCNMNPENVEVELNFTVNALLYNTTNTYHRCSLDNGLCRLNLFLSESSTAVLTTPGPREGVSNSNEEEWFDVKVSYEPRWIIFFTVSGVIAVLLLFAMRFCKMLQTNREENGGLQQVEVVSERTPLLNSKDDDLSSWGSSYESFSNEEEDLKVRLALNADEGKPVMEGETSNSLQHLCVICFDAPKDCFFLPCGHCAACFACGTRIAAEASTCPICRRNMKKVRKIFTV
ncbi:E3 ubiquitin-protein ligase APD2-like [Gastrolobium bilobum]|uniref:E3 ubiquitin-protein ligase APD2-like n=1 Tax=Gastrolobium bilobum TaxID=150636 RepID=UPI002AB323F8|nr:E3 ubiquitin-protein ligase APD2-like [Gastrolobium bilobum]